MSCCFLPGVNKCQTPNPQSFLPLQREHFKQNLGNTIVMLFLLFYSSTMCSYGCAALPVALVFPTALIFTSWSLWLMLMSAGLWAVRLSTFRRSIPLGSSHHPPLVPPMAQFNGRQRPLGMNHCKAATLDLC